MAHVVTKVLVRNPSGAKFNAASAVCRKVFVSNAIATPKYVHPAFVESRMDVAMSMVPFAATAAFRVPIFKLGVSSNRRSSAIASTMPCGPISRLVKGDADNRENAEPFSAKVFDRVPKCFIIERSHLSLLQRFLVRAVNGLLAPWRLVHCSGVCL
jgi:hypothetical protein